MTWHSCKDAPLPEGELILIYLKPHGIWLAERQGNRVAILPPHRAYGGVAVKDVVQWAEIELPEGYKAPRRAKRDEEGE